MTIFKIILSFVALAMALSGGVFLLQGLNVLRGSGMSGDMSWVYRGGGLLVAGAAILLWTLRGPFVLRGLIGLIALVTLVIGAIWILQGVNILPGSFMTGDIQWAYRGAGAVIVAAALLFWMTRKAGATRPIFGAFGALLMLLGCLWALQGLNVLPGSFMMGHIVWTYRGAVMAAIGAGFLFWTGRNPNRAA